MSNQVLPQPWGLCARWHTSAIGLLLIGVDGMDAIVRQHGKPACDKLLRSLGPWLGRFRRQQDLMAYYGEDLFALLVLRATPASLRQIGERLRTSAEKLELEVEGQMLQITFSVGGACAARCEPDASTEDLWAAAAASLVRARELGSGCSDIDPELRLRAA